VEPVTTFSKRTPPSLGKRTDSVRRSDTGGSIDANIGRTHSPGFYWTPQMEEEDEGGGGGGLGGDEDGGGGGEKRGRTQGTGRAFEAIR